MFPNSRSIAEIGFSTREMLEISQEINRDYAPVTSVTSTKLKPKIIISPKELVGISEEISRKYGPRFFTNRPNLVLLHVDPENLCASWNRVGSQIASKSNEVPHEMVLRIYPIPSDINNKEPITPFFDIDIDSSQTRQTVFVPIEPAISAYKAAIGKRDLDGHLIELATSKIVHHFNSNKYPRLSINESSESCNSSHTFSTNQVKPKNTRANASGKGNN